MLVGKELGPYVVEKELGSGAMGTVYRARPRDGGERVAVKLISPAVASNDAALARFTREIAILKQLAHPHIVKYKGSGRYHGTPFYIMEYVEGESLDHVIERRGRLTWEEVVALGTQLCAALQHAHDKGIIHRDLKPSNLMVLRDGTVKLTDFGIAKDTDVTALTAANATVGTASYMSPEQCRGARDVGPKSDLYSMGVMFYELLTGRKPFAAETVMEMFLKHTKEEPIRPAKLVLDLPVWLDNLVVQLMEKKPDQRPYNAETVAQSLALVREKFEAQQSAGVDAATKRRADKTRHDAALDEADKDAARAVLGKKKKKKKAEAFYRKGWFTIAGLGVVAAAFLAVVYFVFLKPPDAERLYADAKALMETGDLENYRAARKGPIKEFLDYHQGHPKAAEVRQWANQAAREDSENSLLSRRRNKVVLGVTEAEEKARKAIDLEEEGNLSEAAERWREVAGFKRADDTQDWAWDLVAEKYLQDLNGLDPLYAELKTKIRSEKILNKPAESSSPWEKRALDAVRAEMDGKATRALWAAARTAAEGRTEARAYYLLAARQVRAAAAAEEKK